MASLSLCTIGLACTGAEAPAVLPRHRHIPELMKSCASSGLEPAAKPDDEWAVHPLRWAEVKRHGLDNKNFDQREIANEFYPYVRGHRHIRRRSLVLTHRLRKGGS